MQNTSHINRPGWYQLPNRIFLNKFLGITAFALFTLLLISPSKAHSSNFMIGSCPGVMDGDGSQGDPCQITDRAQLEAMADSVITILENDYEKIMSSANENVKNRTNYLIGLSYYFTGMYLMSNYYYDQVLNALMEQDDLNNQLLEAVYYNKGVNLELFKKPDLTREYLTKRLHTNTKYISSAVKPGVRPLGFNVKSVYRQASRRKGSQNAFT